MPDRILSEARPTGVLAMAADGTQDDPDQDYEIEEIRQLGLHTRPKRSNIYTNRLGCGGASLFRLAAFVPRNKIRQ